MIILTPGDYPLESSHESRALEKDDVACVSYFLEFKLINLVYL